MKSKYAPILTLILITPFLTELLCSNIPASVFFHPYVFFMTVLVYGLPVLAIRELSIRWNLGILGILIFGVAYGIYNEGICAKTLLLTQNVPIDAFDGYSFLTINFSWSILILVWHALHSILYPILTVTYLYPENQPSTWLNRKLLVLACLLFTTAGVIMFFNTPRIQVPLVYPLLFTGIIICLVFVSKFVAKTPLIKTVPVKTSIYPAILGFCFHLFYVLGLVILAQKKLPELLLLLYAVFILILVYYFLKMKEWLTIPHLLVFAIGDYCGVSFFSTISGLTKGSLEITVVSIFFVILFIMSIYRITRKSRMMETR